MDNDAAAMEAHKGYEMAAKQRKKGIFDQWSYYHQKAVLNRCRDPFRDRLKLKFVINVLTSQYSTAWREYLNLGRHGTEQPLGGARRADNDERIEHNLVERCRRLTERRDDMTQTEWRKAKDAVFDDYWAQLCNQHGRRAKIPGVNWNQYYKQELKLLSRDDVRSLLGIRSGHNHMNLYMCERLKLADFPSTLCYCGREDQTMQHIIRECRDEETQAHVKRMQLAVAEEYYDAWTKWVKDDEKDMPHWTINDLDFTAVRTYAFPIRGITDGNRGKILRQVTKLHRWVLRKSHQARRRIMGVLRRNRRDVPFERG